MNKHQVSAWRPSRGLRPYSHRQATAYSFSAAQTSRAMILDLAVSDNEKTVLVSVKGSQNGGWILTAKSKEGTYESALAEWEKKNARYVFCFVQYEDVALGSMSRIYLALGKDVARHLKTGAWGKIGLRLIERKTITRGPKNGQAQSVSAEWVLSEKRIHALFKAADA